MKYKLCIFDLDGTLIDTLDTIAHFVNGALAPHGLGPIERERFKYFAGDGARNLMTRSLGAAGGAPGILPRALAEYNAAYNANSLHLTTVYEGIPELLAGLRDAGVMSAVLTNKPHDTTGNVLSSLFPAGTFAAYSGDMPGRPLKPDPAGAFEMMRTLGVSPGECVYVGDTGTDMLTGKAAGLFTVGALWGFRGREELEGAGADAIIAHPAELLGLLDEKL